MTQPGISAPEESLTVPRMVPNVDWPGEIPVLSVTHAITQTINRGREEDRLVMSLPVGLWFALLARAIPDAVNPTRMNLKAVGKMC